MIFKINPYSKSGVLTFWTGYLDPRNLLVRGSKYNINKVLKQLLSGQTKSANMDLKRSSSDYPLFGARLNDTHRILFTTIKVGDDSCLLLLDLIKNHQYSKSWVLKKGALNLFFKKNEAKLIDAIKQGIKAHDESAEAKEAKLPLSLEHPDVYYLN